MLLAASKVWSQACALIVLVLGARFLSPEDFGVFALATALSMILNQWVGVGAYEYVIREADDAEAPSSAFWLNTLTAIGFSAVGIAIAQPTADLYHAPMLAPLMMVMSPLAIPAGWRSVGESLLIRRARLGAAGWASIVQETLALAVAVAALMSGWGVWSLAAHKVVQFCASPVIYLIAARWLPSFSWKRDRIDGILRIAGPLTLDRLLAFIMTYGADLVIGLLLNPAAVGVYRIGVRVVTALQAVLIETLKSRAWARLSFIAQKSRPQLTATAEKLAGQGWIVCAPAFIGLALTADLIVDLALGPDWMQSAHIVQILSLSALCSVVTVVMEPMCAIHSRVSVLAAVRVGAMVVLIPAVVFAAPQGPEFVAWVQLAVAFALTAVTLTVQQRMFGMRWDASRTEVLAALTGCGVMWAAVAGVRALFGPVDGLPMVFAELAASIIAGAAAYALTLWGIRRRLAPRLFASWVG
jgi:O-antigen/teichoic acid export membrane protein